MGGWGGHLPCKANAHRYAYMNVQHPRPGTTSVHFSLLGLTQNYTLGAKKRGSGKHLHLRMSIRYFTKGNRGAHASPKRPSPPNKAIIGNLDFFEIVTGGLCGFFLCVSLFQHLFPSL